MTPSFHPAESFGGPIRTVYRLCVELSRLGTVSVRVLTTDTNGKHTRERLHLPGRTARWNENLTVVYARKSLGADFSFDLLASLPAEMRRADVVHLTGVYSSPTFPVLLCAGLERKPVLWSPRGSLMDWGAARRRRLKAAWRRVARLVAGKHTAFHVTSASEAEHAVRAMPGIPVLLVPNGVDVPLLPERIADADGVFRIVFMGRLHPVKGLENLIRAVALTTGKTRLDIYGGGTQGYTASLRELTEALGISARVVFHGPIEETRKTEAFARADVFVLPSHSENFGLAAAEALAHAVPVIAGKGTPWEGLETHGCGLWVENDPLSLAHALSAMAGADLRAMGEAGRKWVTAEFSWPCIAERICRVYDDLIERSRWESREKR
ncbi:MAG: glycosyltransferase [Bacteroidota bacterium]|nr:glycosyltransferase [Bacteroidota bacterium]